jgi:4'-phosphopantetheinyl transferase
MLSQLDWPIGHLRQSTPIEEEIVCWRVLLDRLSKPDLDFLFQLLDSNEQSRANTFLKEADKHRYIAAHGVLRIFLNEMLGEKGYTIAKNAYGKPYVSQASIQFNLSHSGNMILLAFTNNIPIGVDIEQMRSIDNVELIIKEYLHPSEVKELFACQLHDLDQVFFSCWSKKEAVSKALGLGLSFPLNAFSVSSMPLLGNWRLNLPIKYPQSWTLLAFKPLNGYFAAIAAPKPGLIVRFQTVDFAALQ